MKKIDFFIQQMARVSAVRVELVSGAPARFVFQKGQKDSNKVTDHAQLVAMVKEIASAQVAADLKASGNAALTYSLPGSAPVQINVQIQSPTAWRVSLIGQASSATSQVTQTSQVSRAAVEAQIATGLDDPELTIPKAGPMPTGLGPALPAEQVDAPPLRPAPAAAPPSQSSDEQGSKASLAPLLSEVPLGPDEPAINRYLRKMIKLGASDLHLSSGVPPMVRLHGEMKRLEDRDAFRHEELNALLRQVMPERNITEFEETHDTDFAHTIEGVARFRVNVFMDRKGVGTVIRQIPFEILSPEQLGLPKQVLDLCWLSKGLVVVTGPTGSGKSTTLATMVDYINKNRSDHIITIEDPIEFVHPNKKCLVNQREINTHTNSFKRALRAALREDPDIVLVGEMRDLETIAIAIETAETGHLVFGTLHTTTAPSTVDRIIDQFPPDQQSQIRVMLSESLKGVIAQILCKKKTKGRVAAYEILITTSAISNLIREGKTFQIPSAMQTGRNLGMRLMNDHLLELVLSGQVDVQEAYIRSADKQTFKTMLSQNNITLEKAPA